LHPNLSRSPRFSVFITIFVLFSTVVLLTGAAITVGNYLQTRNTAFEVASTTFDSAIRRINARRAAFFAPITLVVELYGADPLLSSSMRVPESIIQPILQSLRTYPQLSSVYAGYENGDFIQIVSVTGREGVAEAIGGPDTTRYAVQTIELNNDGVREQIWTFFDDSQKEIGRLTVPTPTYDPRERGWYEDAQAQAGELIRTPPYTFDAAERLGLTIAKTLNEPSRGVIGADITLDQFSNFLEDVRPNSQHRILAFDKDGNLIASPDPDQIFKRSSSGEAAALEPSNITDLKDPVVSEAARLFKLTGPFELEAINITGEEYLASVVHQAQEDSEGLYIMYAAPRSDFEGSLAGSATRSLIPGLLVLLLALPAIIYLARMISRPLKKLSAEAGLIRSFNLDDPIDMNSPVLEIDALIGSMSGMKSTLREISKFVPKTLVKDILEEERDVVVGGEKRHISLLFTDVKDFTPISESMGPEELMTNMSEYFEELVSLIIKEGGTVDKFVGDAIFAYWNAPLPTDKYECAACMAALKCRIASKHLSAQWRKDGRLPWITRFGVHAGDAVVGNVGSSDRIDYTVIGDTVNIASRLEGLNKYYGTNILVSGQIADACADELLFRRVDHSLPKGAVKPLEILELLGMFDGPDEFRIKPEQAKLVVDWNEAYEVYASRNWVEALDAVENFLIQYPEDGVAAIYLERIMEFLIEPPDESWDGIKRFAKK
jgi:adenylate cyclase